MKARDRKIIDNVVAQLFEHLGPAKDVAEELRITFEELSERAQEGERGQAMEQEADEFEEAVSELESAIETLDSVGA